MGHHGPDRFRRLRRCRLTRMRLRDVATGVIVNVDDARGAEMVGSHWELADQPEPAKETPAETPRKRQTRTKSTVE
jgi:hypothetical protein